MPLRMVTASPVGRDVWGKEVSGESRLGSTEFKFRSRDDDARTRRVQSAPKRYVLRKTDAEVSIILYLFYRRQDVEFSCLLLLRRAVDRLRGLFVAYDPGIEYVLQHPRCISLRRLIGAPSDAAMISCLAADNVIAQPGRYSGIHQVLTTRGVEVLRYEGKDGKNWENNGGIKWLKMDDETVEHLYATPSDQMASGHAVSAADLDFIRNGIRGGGAQRFRNGIGGGGAQRVSVDGGDVPRHRGIPAYVEVHIHDSAGRRVVHADAEDDRSYAAAHLVKSMRRVDASGAITVTLQRKFLGGGRDLTFVQRTQLSGGESRRTKGRHMRNVESFVTAGCSNEEADALLGRLAKRTAAFKEVEEMLEDKGSGAPSAFTDAESKYILNVVGTKSMYREIASILRLK